MDTQTLLGAIAAYLMAGMSFAFAYQALGALQAAPSSGPKGGNLHHLLVLAGERAGHDRETGRAHALCRKLLSFAGLLLLCAEEIDATTGQHLGNFPQAFTDLALLDALTRLIEMEETASKEGSAAAAA